MTIGSSPSTDELREQAATWFARMRGPNADALKPEFERWLGSSIERRTAYNRIAARFSEAKLLHTSSLPNPSRIPGHSPAAPVLARRWALALAALIGLSCTLITAYPHLFSDLLPWVRRQRPAQLAAVVTTRHGDIRTLRLADGSIISLDTDSLLTVHFTANRRDVRLARGRARFDVAHDGRPFVVAAGNGTVTARGTLFDVTIDPRRRVQVLLIRGAVDVAAHSSAATTIRRLRPGDAIGFNDTFSPRSATIVSPPQPSWPAGLVDFDETPLGAVLAEANRYATTPIVLADPALRTLRVSGRFGVRDSDALAANLARLFDLTVDRSHSRAIILRGPPA